MDASLYQMADKQKLKLDFCEGFNPSGFIVRTQYKARF